MNMFKKVIVMILAAMVVLALAACGDQKQPESTTEATQIPETQESVTEAPETESESVEATSADAETEEETEDVTEEETTQAETEGTISSADGSYQFGTVSNTLASSKVTLTNSIPSRFEQLTYEDSESGLSIEFNLYLPEGYDENGSYPMVVFIADSSVVGSGALRSLNQGRGGVVWATDEWQSVYPTIVAVPTYNVTVLDDHSGFYESEYVELTKKFIDYMCSEYAVDTDRIYGTGQSMGCMISLILASRYPDLYAACMFVDGQWDVTTLSGLENQTFVYFAAEGDQKAWTGSQEVMAMFDTDSEDYIYRQWDGTWDVDELSDAAAEMFTADEDQFFVSWLNGTIGGSDAGGGGGAGVHMASFDYAYNCVAVMEWLFAQSK